MQLPTSYQTSHQTEFTSGPLLVGIEATKQHVELDSMQGLLRYALQYLLTFLVPLSFQRQVLLDQLKAVRPT